MVFTDSLSSLHLIKSFNLSHRNLILKIIESILKIMDRRGEIVIQWIPSHYGIPGNEFVDTLANRAHSLPDITKVEDSFSDLQRLCSERTMKYWLSERENILSLTFLGQIRDNVTVPFQCFIREETNRCHPKAQNRTYIFKCPPESIKFSKLSRLSILYL